jgi:hypothetical protein
LSLLLLLVVVNRRFYAYLADKRGPLFAAAAIPLHVFYFLYSGFAFVTGAARYALRFSMAALLLTTGAWADDGWVEFRSGPFHVLTKDAEKNARSVLNELEQIRHVLGAMLGKQELNSVWPIRLVVVKDRRGTVYPEPRLARDAYVASLMAAEPETRVAVVRLLIDSNAGPLPVSIESGLVTLFSTFQADGTHLTLGAAPARKDRDWSRINLLSTDPRFSGKLRVLLGNLQQGADLEPAYRNAFEMKMEDIEREVDRYIEAGKYATSAPSARAIDPDRKFVARTADPKLVALTQLDILVANGKAGAEEYAKYPGAENAAVPLMKAGQLEAAAKANPLWAEPWWLEAQKEQNALRRVQLLTKATQLAPRRFAYWLALARAHESAEQYTEAVKSWAMAERTAPSRQDKEQIRQSRLAGEEMRAEKLRLEREEDQRRAKAELEALRQRALADIRAAEARANAGKPPLDPSKLEEYRENMGYEKAGGRLDRVDCLGRSARLTVTKADGSALRLLVVDPTKVVITGGGERALGCGPQRPARTVVIEYVVKSNAKLGTSGEVGSIEFR